MTTFVFPAALTPGDRVWVVAPSSPFPRTELLRGLAFLGGRYALRARTSIFDRAGYLAGSDEVRTHALAEAMRDPEAKAIVMARGGYGTTRILDRLPWDDFARAPKWLVGFSDVTALHAETTARGIASIHAPNVTGLSATAPRTRACLLRALERPHAPVTWQNLHVHRAGRTEGVLVGGNLSLVCAMAMAGRWHPPSGAILALEDVTERPYRVDRMLTSLRDGGHLARIGGIVLGEFTQCDPGPDGATITEVLAERLGDLGVPMVGEAPFGHGARNEAFTLGALARIEGDRVVLGTGA